MNLLSNFFDVKIFLHAYGRLWLKNEFPIPRPLILIFVFCYAPIKVLPHLPPCGQTRDIARGLNNYLGPGAGGLDND